MRTLTVFQNFISTKITHTWLTPAGNGASAQPKSLHDLKEARLF